jgi:Sucrose synthase
VNIVKAVPIAGVLGKPDTGGQIVYILDQVRALETEMLKRIDEAGLDIEPGAGTGHAWAPAAAAGRYLCS